jgi:hypothetical protein
MLIQIPKVYTDETEEKTVDIWINTELIIKIEPYLNEKQPSIAKSIIAMRDVEPWNWFKSTMTPEEIVDRIKRKPYFDVLDALKKYNKTTTINCPNCGNYAWQNYDDNGNLLICTVCNNIFKKEEVVI